MDTSAVVDADVVVSPGLDSIMVYQSAFDAADPPTGKEIWTFTRYCYTDGAYSACAVGKAPGPPKPRRVNQDIR